MCFVLIAAVLLTFRAKPSAEPADTADEDDGNGGRQSLPARLAWAGWMSLSAAACFGLAQLTGALLPPLALPLRGAGVVLLAFAAYKLLFGRRGQNNDIDL